MFNDSLSPIGHDYMELWGTKIDSDSQRDLEEAFAINIVMACIDINEERARKGSKYLKAGLYLEKENERYQVCHLNQDWLQQPLNLVFEETLGIRLLVVGNTPIYIYGYRMKEVGLFAKTDRKLSSPLSANLDGSGTEKYSHIIDTTCYTISDGDSKGSSREDSKSLTPSSESSRSNVDYDYTSESTALSESLGSSTSTEHSTKRKGSRKKKKIDKTD